MVNISRVISFKDQDQRIEEAKPKASRFGPSTSRSEADSPVDGVFVLLVDAGRLLQELAHVLLMAGLDLCKAEDKSSGLAQLINLKSQNPPRTGQLLAHERGFS